MTTSGIARPLIRNLALVPIPLLTLFWAASAVYRRYFTAEPTIWADPDYTYLLNGQTIAQGVAPWHVEHPGTPIQSLNALMQFGLWFTDLLDTRSLSLAASVVSKPEENALAVSILWAVAIPLASLVLGYRMTSPFGVPYAFLAQTSPLVIAPFAFKGGFGSLYDATIVGNRPEPFLLIGLILVTALLAPTLGVTPARQLRTWELVTLGLLIGALTATKLSVAIVVLFLPIALLSIRNASKVYLWAALGFALLLTPIWFRLPASISIWRTWSSYADSPMASFVSIQRWLPRLVETQFPVIGFFLLTSALYLLFATVEFARKRSSRASEAKASTAPSQVNTHAVTFVAIALVVVLFQLTYSQRWYAWWLLPAFPIVIFGSAVALKGIALGSRGRITRVLPASIAGLVSSVIVFPAVAAIPTAFSQESVDRFQSLKSLSKSLQQLGSLAVYDYSVTWSLTTLGDKCTSLISGDAFAREVSYDQVSRECPNYALAGFDETSVKPLTPLWDRDPLAANRYALYCADLARIAGEPGGLHIVTPDRDFAYINATTVTQEGGWRLSKVNSIDCTGSPVRNETPNPATVAARERIANMPIIGFLYRNWPWQ